MNHNKQLPLARRTLSGGIESSLKMEITILLKGLRIELKDKKVIWSFRTQTSGVRFTAMIRFDMENLRASLDAAKKL